MSTDAPTVQRSFRLSRNTADLLDDRARELSQSRNSLADRLIDEGLRMERHPLIGFRTGASGLRRPALVGTRLYVWQVLSTLRASGSIHDAANYLELSEAQVQAARDYYAEFKDEVDRYWAEDDAYAEREQARWERARQSLS